MRAVEPKDNSMQPRVLLPVPQATPYVPAVADRAYGDTRSDIGTFIIIVGCNYNRVLGGPLFYNYSKEPPK